VDPSILELALAASAVIFSLSGAVSLFHWTKHRIENAVDEREERQANDRTEARHRRRLETLDKLETVASIVIADQSIATTLRDKIDEEFPKVRVEVEEEEAEEERPASRRRRKKP